MGDIKITSLQEADANAIDGIKVYKATEDRFKGFIIIDAPKHYDVTWKFTAMTRASPEDSEDEKVRFAQRLDDPSVPKDRDYFFMLEDRVDTQQKATNFDFMIREARALNREYQQELSQVKTMLTQVVEADPKHAGKKVDFTFGQPTKKDEKTNEYKPLGYAIGEVLHRGKFLTVIPSSPREDMVKFRVIENHRFLLNGQEMKPENRETILRMRLPYDPTKAINLDPEAEGKKKLFFKFVKGKIEVSPYRARQQEQKAEATPYEVWTDKALHAVESNDELAKGNKKFNPMGVRVAGTEAGQAYAAMLQADSKLTENATNVVFPKEIAGKPLVEEGFKYGFLSKYREVYPEHKDVINFVQPEQQQQVAEQKKTRSKAKEKAPELSV
ncbi:hypothetical protein [Paraburkholderia fungorum]|jgi:hypothetical protein|uniref:hypothetical protein n=1 Tax=Paraburkholderia fungorum TaxID=134537 RepID=UPI000D07D2D1|nr:hypothetical protein [Paraburkholderia fungorum]PRZ50692.1 hypothetical protein BX589_124130 [Paraburkholderia fungorum]